MIVLWWGSDTLTCVQDPGGKLEYVLGYHSEDGVVRRKCPCSVTEIHPHIRRRNETAEPDFHVNLITDFHRHLLRLASDSKAS